MLAGVAIAVLGVLAVTTTADARRAPTRREATAISAALHKSHAIRRGLCFYVRNIAISTAGPWARAKVVRCGDGHHFDTALAVLQRSHGTWRVRDLGTADTGCTVAPARVRRDLRLVCA
jgi:hypothetical protein